MLVRNASQPGTTIGTISNSGWKKAGKKVLSIRGSEIRLHSNSFETKDGNAQPGDPKMILRIDLFVLKCSRGVFVLGLLRQSHCVLSMAQRQCLEQPPQPQHSPVALDVLSKASNSFLLLQFQSNAGTFIQRNLLLNLCRSMNFSVLPYCILKMHGRIYGLQRKEG